MVGAAAAGAAPEAGAAAVPAFVEAQPAKVSVASNGKGIRKDGIRDIIDIAVLLVGISVSVNTSARYFASYCLLNFDKKSQHRSARVTYTGPVMAVDRLSDLPEARRKVLVHLKLKGGATIAELASLMGISGEAVRQQLAPLESEGSIVREGLPADGAGRPAVRFRLTSEGERLFPKGYDDLVVMLVDAVRLELGDEALIRILTRLTDERVAKLEPGLRKLGFRQKMNALKAIYDSDDPFVEVREVQGGYQLIERNCPFLSVALLRPLLCSCTVSTLTRLLERQVVREQRFQDGGGCCTFRVYTDRPVDISRLRFAREPEFTPPAPAI